MNDDHTKKFDTGHWMSLKEYLGVTLAPIQTELAQVRNALEKLAVSTAEHDQMRYQVSALSELLQDLERMNVDQEKRISKLEHYGKIAVWIFGIVSAVGLAMLTRWATGFIP